MSNLGNLAQLLFVPGAASPSPGTVCTPPVPYTCLGKGLEIEIKDTHTKRPGSFVKR